MHPTLTPSTREHPWHLRRATTIHHERFRNLAELHSLTGRCLAELRIERPRHLLKRGGSPEIAESLWMLDVLADVDGERSLESLLDDTLPEDILGRLEHAAHAVQSWTLSFILDKSGEKDASAVRNQLEQVSWRAGREFASQKWATPAGEHAAFGSDLRTLVAALRRHPLAPSNLGEPFLIERALATAVNLQLLLCPHRSPYAETQPAADTLCALHGNWIRGFLYALNPRITIEHRMEPMGRCSQRWSLTT